MTNEERVHAVTEHGFTERQARFLVFVMLHAGVCVPRQYAQYAGTAYGRWVGAFFKTLVRYGYASVSACLHNRAVLYHVRHHALYRAIGEPNSRHRRSMSMRQALERLMLLDMLIASSEFTWLGTEHDKVAALRTVLPAFPADRLPHTVTSRGGTRRVRLFPDPLPVGISIDGGHVVFPYLITSPFMDGLRDFVQRHSDVCRALPRWTLRLVVPREAARSVGAFNAAVREELTAQLAPEHVYELKWMFQQRRAAADKAALSRSDERFWLAEKMFSATRYGILYRRWLMDGDTAFELVTSPRLAEALTSDAGRIEPYILRRRYDHLVRAASDRQSTQFGVEERDENAARSQPLLPSAPGAYRERWRRLVQAANRSVSA